MDYIPFVVTIGIVCLSIYGIVRCCCLRGTSHSSVILSPVMITSETHRVNPGTTATQAGTIVQGYPTGTSAYPIMSAAHPSHHPAPYPGQPYMQHYPLHASAAQPPAVPPHQQPTAVQFPSLPAGAQIPPLPAAPTAPCAPPMFYPPSYDQVVSDFKG